MSGTAQPLAAMEPGAFLRFLETHGIHRFWFAADASGRLRASHSQLDPLTRWLDADRRDFAGHEGLFFRVSRTTGHLLGAFIHRTCRGQGAGGVRYWHYATVEDFLRDGLRLSQGMTHKCALAGLWWGGGKGVIARPRGAAAADSDARRALFEEYGEFVSSLSGCYVTAEDVGAGPQDMAAVFSRTRFTTSIPPEVGGSGNPSEPTARGTVCAMEAALEFLGQGTLAGKTVAVQGTGHVGTPLVRLVLGRGARKVVACDLSQERVLALRSEFPPDRLDINVSAAGDLSILSAACDVLSPCATGGVLNARTIPQVRARLVCGAANNQLEDPVGDDRRLLERGITYVPDFLANRMGIVNCSNEQYGSLSPDPAIEQHLTPDWEHSIRLTTLRVLETSKKTGHPPGQVAVELAEELSRQLHPLFGHRSFAIVQSLVARKWHNEKDD